MGLSLFRLKQQPDFIGNTMPVQLLFHHKNSLDTGSDFFSSGKGGGLYSIGRPGQPVIFPVKPGCEIRFHLDAVQQKAVFITVFQQFGPQDIAKTGGGHSPYRMPKFSMT